MQNIPIKSHHCTTTHSACECVLERLKKLEKLVTASKAVKGDLEAKDEQPLHFSSWFTFIDAIKDLEGEG